MNPFLKYSLKSLLIVTALGIFLLYIQFYSGISVNIGSSDWWIRHHNYVLANPTTGTKDVYIITKGNWFINYKRYSVKKDDTLDIKVRKDSELILSLYTHVENHGFKWHITNNTNPDIVRCIEDGFMESSAFKIKLFKGVGGSERRENFLIKTYNKGDSSIDIKYLYGGDIDRMKATGNYDNIMSQQFDFHINVHVK